MEWILWAVLITALLSFCVFVYRTAYVKGYKAGATMVLEDWKKTMEKLGE